MRFLVGKMREKRCGRTRLMAEIAHHYAIRVSEFVRKLPRARARDTCDEKARSCHIAARAKVGHWHGPVEPILAPEPWLVGLGCLRRYADEQSETALGVSWIS